MTSFWHPFADMAAVEAGGGPSIVRGRDPTSGTRRGNRYLDSTAGLWFCNVGHGRAEIAEGRAAPDGRARLYSTFGDLTNPPTEALASGVAGLAPMPSAKVF
jgi:adenosylmethionine-8-amino-7-oxononanoate aminotransferase